eukprot:10084944-Alexandrium_andersonii.AAC.1
MSAHVPFRSWCSRCVRGRMSNTPRASSVPGGHAVPEVAMGSCFLTKDGSGTSLTVLAIKDREPRAILARPVLCKGRLHDDT